VKRKRIHPGRLYPLAEAARFVPSVRGKSLHPDTLRRWAKAHRFEFVERTVGGVKQRFIRGKELLRLAAGGTVVPAAVELPRTAREERAAATWARSVLEEFGYRGPRAG
jgi:hypothetical protein